jgi:hypothetical protein
MRGDEEPSEVQRALGKATVLLTAALSYIAVMCMSGILSTQNRRGSPTFDPAKSYLILIETGVLILVMPFVAVQGAIRLFRLNWMLSETQYNATRTRAWAETIGGLFTIALSVYFMKTWTRMIGGAHFAVGTFMLVSGIRHFRESGGLHVRLSRRTTWVIVKQSPATLR